MVDFLSTLSILGYGMYSYLLYYNLYVTPLYMYYSELYVVELAVLPGLFALTFVSRIVCKVMISLDAYVRYFAATFSVCICTLYPV